MKKVTLLAIALVTAFSLAAIAQTEKNMVIETSAGPVIITPIAHATVRVEAGGKTIYLDPAPPAKVAGLPEPI